MSIPTTSHPQSPSLRPPSRSPRAPRRHEPPSPPRGSAITQRLVEAASRRPRYQMPRNDAGGALQLHLNENLLGVEGRLPEDLRAPSFADLVQYPEGGDRPLREAIAAAHGVDERAIFVNTGASAVINQILAAFANTGATALLPSPTWNYYHLALAGCGIRWREVPLRRDADRFTYDRDAWLTAVERDAPSLIAVISPNNPTGNRLGGADIVAIARAAEDSLMMVDEAYHGLAEPDSMSVAEILAAAPNVVFVRTFSKAYGLAGLRVGFALAGPVGQALLGTLPVPFGIPAFAQKLAIARLADTAFLDEVRATCAESRDVLRRRLGGVPGLAVYESAANFVLVRAPSGRGRAAWERLRQHGYLTKLLDGDLEDHLRITMAAPPVMERVAELLSRV